MKTKRRNVVASLAGWCVCFLLTILVGWGECGAAATGAAGGATAEGASNQLERCSESLGTLAVVEDQGASDRKSVV